MLGLSKREREVFDLVSKGVSDHDAGEKLKISRDEFDSAWKAIEEKLDAAEVSTDPDHALLFKYERVRRKRLEAELHAADARLNALMDTAPEAVLVVNGRTGRITQANNNAFMMFGYPPSELIGLSVEELVPINKRGIHELYRHGFLNSVRKRDLGFHPPIYAMKKDGTRLDLDIALTATSATDDVMVVCQYAAVAEAVEAEAV